MTKHAYLALAVMGGVALSPAHAAQDIIPRCVAMELVTASWCGYCPQADAAAEQLRVEEGRAGTIFIEYHMSDALSNADGDARRSYYGNPGTPTMIFGGITKVIGAGGPMYNTYRQRFNGRRNYDPMVDIRLTGDMTGNNTWTVQGSVEVIEQLWQQGTPELRIALTENDLTAGSRHYNGVLRDHVANIDLNGKNVGSMTYFSQSISINGAWKKDDLNVVVYVQEPEYKEILGAKRLSEVPMDVDGDSFTVSRGDMLSVPIDMRNISRNDQDLEIWMIAYRNGTQIGPNPIFQDSYSIMSGDVDTYTMNFPIPMAAPTGTYSVAAWIGTSLDDTLEWDRYEVTIQ
ncbi:MAG: hypothetical protein CME06_16750 [Gemmatimonadetes bacterium]|nr:hypothetical protein [Gemmatimonadota bacterium]